MKKLLRRIVLCFLVAAMVWLGSVFADREKLGQELVRLHVVANSDTAQDQQVKLRVRDAIVESMRADLAAIGSTQEARQYLTENLSRLQTVANQVLEEAGMEPNAVVTLCREAFDTRAYDTFTLPAGVYDALRVTIGEGAGQNWWCVAFPTLCLPATSSDFTEAAVEAGLSDGLSKTLAGEPGYEVRFYVLDVLGKLENKLFRE